MNNHGNDKKAGAPANSRGLEREHPFAVREAEGAELDASELAELERAHDAISFLDRVRIDLQNFGMGNGQNNSEAYVSTRGDENTLAENLPSKSSAIAETFGRFKIVGTIGQGGFARVFRAYDPVLDRDVALKIPKLHALVSAESATRFRREARAAAMLSHPAIVSVFESGEIGVVSYIASEYCEGETLAEWFNGQDRKINARAAAAIVARLAEAVEHAHQRGVIHRDLKPANVLLDNSSFDGEIADRLRITDFGLAKQIDAAGDPLTLEGAVVGTPAYMSPEQARGSNETAAASDVYALGVILFELLSSQLPFNRNNHLETLRAVESEPAPVLTRMDRTIPRDLSAICQKCLSKSAADRYATAFDLAEDLNAWLNNRPVKARPVSAARKLRQWYARNTALALALGFAFLSLTLGLVVSVWQWNSAVSNSNRADAQLVQTQQANQQSQKRLLQIENFSQTLTGIFDDLNIERVNHSNEPLEQVLADRLISVGTQLNEGMDDRLLEAEMLTDLAQSLIALGFASEAIGFAESAVDIRSELLDENDLLTASSRSCLGDAYRESGKYQQALEQHQLTLDTRTDVLEPDSPETLASINQVAVDLQNLGEFDAAIEKFELVLAKKLLVLDKNDPATLTSMNNLASGHMSNGQYNIAEAIYLETLQLRQENLTENHFDTLTSMDQLARCYLAQEKTADALPLLKETLRRRVETLGSNHPATLTSISSLASGYRADGQLDKALELFQEVLELRKIRLGEEHELTVSSINDLAAIHFSLKNYDEALPLLEESYAAFEHVLHEDHYKVLLNMQNLAGIHYQQKNYDRAIDLLNESITLMRVEHGLEYVGTVSGLKQLANILLNLGRYEESIKQHTILIEALTLGRGADDPQTLQAKAGLGDCYRWARQYELAIEKLEPVLAADYRISDYEYYRRALRSAYARSGRTEKFQRMADEDLAKCRTTLEPGSEKLRSKIAGIGLDCLFARNYEMAKSLLGEAVEILEKSNANTYSLPNNQTLLGEALMELDDFDAAGPLLISGYAGLVKHEQSIHPLARADAMIEAAERLLRFYQHQGDAEKVEQISEELQQLRIKYER